MSARAAAVDHRHARGAELRALARDVDGGVAAADDDDALAGDLALVTARHLELHALDPRRRAEDARAVLAGDAERACRRRGRRRGTRRRRSRGASCRRCGPGRPRRRPRRRSRPRRRAPATNSTSWTASSTWSLYGAMPVVLRPPAIALLLEDDRLDAPRARGSRRTRATPGPRRCTRPSSRSAPISMRRFRTRRAPSRSPSRSRSAGGDRSAIGSRPQPL